MAVKPPPVRAVVVDPHKDPDDLSTRIVLPLNQVILWLGNAFRNAITIKDNTASVVTELTFNAGDTSAYPFRVAWPYSDPPTGVVVVNARQHLSPVPGFTGTPFASWTFDGKNIVVSSLTATFTPGQLYTISLWAF